MTLGLGHLDAGDTFGRIVPAHGRHGGPQQAANSFSQWRLADGFSIAASILQDMLALQQRDALITMLGAEAFDDAPAGLLGVVASLLPVVRPVVGHHERVDSAGQRSARADRDYRAGPQEPLHRRP